MTACSVVDAATEYKFNLSVNYHAYNGVKCITWAKLPFYPKTGVVTKMC